MRRTVPARCGNVSEVAQGLRRMWRRHVNSHVRREAYVATLDSAPDCEVLNTPRLGVFDVDPMGEWGVVDGRPREHGAVTLNGAGHVPRPAPAALAEHGNSDHRLQSFRELPARASMTRRQTSRRWRRFSSSSSDRPIRTLRVEQVPRLRRPWRPFPESCVRRPTGGPGRTPAQFRLTRGTDPCDLRPVG